MGVGPRALRRCSDHFDVYRGSVEVDQFRCCTSGYPHVRLGAGREDAPVLYGQRLG